MALWRRKPTSGLVYHSDRGVFQYTALSSFGKCLEEAGIALSMGRAGSALDNAMAESFVSTLKRKLVHRHRFPTREAARVAIFEYIERRSYSQELTASDPDEAVPKPGGVGRGPAASGTSMR